MIYKILQTGPNSYYPYYIDRKLIKYYLYVDMWGGVDVTCYPVNYCSFMWTARRVIKKHILDGVDFITVHSGITKDSIKLIEKRLMGVVSRGGSFLVKWMKHNNQENPLYESFDKILFWAKKYDVTLSLGDALRPGCLKDATDKAQLQELKTLGELQKIAFKENVQSMIEGPGHVPLDQIEHNIKLQKEMQPDNI